MLAQYAGFDVGSPPPCQGTISMPMLLAVPATVLMAASRVAAPMSYILMLAISASCSGVMLPTVLVLGSPEPLSTPAASFSRNAVGGDFTTKVKELSSKTVISTRSSLPLRWLAFVLSLNCLTNSPMFVWNWFRAGPTGGAGFACPPGIVNFTLPATFLAMAFLLLCSRKTVLIRFQ